MSATRCQVVFASSPACGVEDPRPVPPGGVHDQLPGPYGSGVGEALDQARQRVVRDGQQDQVYQLMGELSESA